MPRINPPLLAPVVFSEDWSMDQVLTCPNCGGDYLHHGTVTVFDRQEDAEAVVTKISGKHYHTEGPAPPDWGNPSSRRHGLAITFACETCTVSAELTIAQHKGSTQIEWRYIVLPDPESEE